MDVRVFALTADVKSVTDMASVVSLAFVTRASRCVVRHVVLFVVARCKRNFESKLMTCVGVKNLA